MDIEKIRKIARQCWRMSSSFSYFPPAAREFLGRELSVQDEKFKRNRELLVDACERLILIDDDQARGYVIRAMGILEYPSRSIGLIASFCAFKEAGTTQNSAVNSSKESLAFEARGYLHTILNIPKFFPEWEKIIRHWENVFTIDYRRDYRHLPEPELETKIQEIRSSQLATYQHTVKEFLEQALDSDLFMENKYQVHKNLGQIIHYSLTNLDTKTGVVVLSELEFLARIGHFPARWLIELTEQYSK